MSLYVDRGQIVSVAHVNCPKCFGTGMYAQQNNDGKTVKIEVGFCDCIKITGPSREGDQ
jgi:hypothetical protein